MSLHAALEQPNYVAVVRVLRETKASAIVHEFFEFLRLVLAQILNCCLLFLLFDVGIFLSLRSAWQSLPRKRSFQEVKDHVTDCLQIISSRLFVSQMSIQTRISGSSCQVFPVSERDVLTIR